VKLVDYEKEVMDIKEDVATVKADVNNLKGWQASQNGSILRIESRLEKLNWWFIATLGGITVQLFLTLVK
jgi:hypothetical protein